MTVSSKSIKALISNRRARIDTRPPLESTRRSRSEFHGPQYLLGNPRTYSSLALAPARMCRSHYRMASSTSTRSRSIRGYWHLVGGTTPTMRTRIPGEDACQRRQAFLERTDNKYNPILFALADSLTLVSGASALRLESYLYTEEALESARQHLAPCGRSRCTTSIASPG
jgi:hypothetical protein